MTSKEALKEIDDILYINAVRSQVQDKILSMLEIIKQELDRLEKLEKENIELQKINEEFLQVEIETVKLIDKLKKVIEILKSKFKFELGVSVVKEKYCYSLEFLYNNQYFTITQEQYNLLKEVL